MTKEDWAEIEKGMQRVGWPVKLDCDGFQVVLLRCRISEMRDAIVVVIDGKINEPDRTCEDCEERRRFYYSRKAYKYTRKSRELWKQLKPSEKKRVLQERGSGFDINETFTAFMPFWPSFKELKSHLTKNNKQISIIAKGAQVNGLSC